MKFLFLFYEIYLWVVCNCKVNFVLIVDGISGGVFIFLIWVGLGLIVWVVFVCIDFCFIGII